MPSFLPFNYHITLICTYYLLCTFHQNLATDQISLDVALDRSILLFGENLTVTIKILALKETKNLSLSVFLDENLQFTPDREKSVQNCQENHTFGHCSVLVTNRVEILQDKNDQSTKPNVFQQITVFDSLDLTKDGMYQSTVSLLNLQINSTYSVNKNFTVISSISFLDDNQDKKTIKTQSNFTLKPVNLTTSLDGITVVRNSNISSMDSLKNHQLTVEIDFYALILPFRYDLDFSNPAGCLRNNFWIHNTSYIFLKHQKLANVLEPNNFGTQISLLLSRNLLQDDTVGNSQRISLVINITVGFKPRCHGIEGRFRCFLKSTIFMINQLKNIVEFSPVTVTVTAPIVTVEIYREESDHLVEGGDKIGHKFTIRHDEGSSEVARIDYVGYIHIKIY